MIVKKLFRGTKRKRKGLAILSMVGLMGGFFINYVNNSYEPVLSEVSLTTMKQLNNEYGFTFGEDLLADPSRSNALASFLGDDLLEAPGASGNQGLILKINDTEAGALILMTPKKAIDSEDLWGIADQYTDIPEIEFAEPDIELEIYSIGEMEELKAVEGATVELNSYSALHTRIIEKLLQAALPQIKQASTTSEFQKSATTQRAVRNKWWEKKDDTNYSLRARLNFPKTANRTTIGILDSGIDITHDRLEKQIWENTAERANNRTDDDHNGFIDDIYGWDFTHSLGGIIGDSIGHGTHISGIIGKYSPNPLATLKVFDKKSESRLSYAVKAIKYGADNGMRVLNVSFGARVDLRTFREIVDYADARGTFIVAAAGNNNSSKQHYPAAYEKVISVGALNAKGARLAESNYNPTKGEAWIDVWAPGERVLSTIPSVTGKDTNRYGYLSGTSQAAPFVTAALANLLHDSPNMTVDQAREALKAMDFSEMRGPHPSDIR
ncbi:S8 family serine peptidase [Candidatus Peregrinibacteria bacterium]|jgi:subtilisin family serine protease|nr:S8 family serine peptidase [Candidatus Peregrinibacteria bacterium]